MNTRPIPAPTSCGKPHQGCAPGRPFRPRPKARAAAALALAALGLGPAVHAQSNVSVYGSLDVSISHIDNVQGQSLWRLDTGSLYANRLGFRGQEDLGGGLKAVFVLENGFNVDTGTVAQGGVFFGRQSFAGLSSTTWGSVTLGRQYDFLYAGSPLPLDVGALLIGGLAGASGGAGTAVDNHSGGVRYDNSVKWLGKLGPWTLGAMYGLGNETPGQRMRSFVAAYRSGPVWAGLGHLRDTFSAAAAGNQITLASLNWDLRAGDKLIVTLSQAQGDQASDRQSRSRMLQLGWQHDLTPAWMLGITGGWAQTRDARRVSGDIRQYAVATHYRLSKRTTLYAMGSRVQASGSAGTAYSGVPGIGAPAATLRSSDGAQSVVRAGLLHRF